MKGQLESSFQWIFVLIAGGAFLVFFFLLIRGCADQGEATIQGLAVQSAATRLQASTWQRDSVSNLSVQSADVVCVGDVITLRTDRADAPLERAAVFLPRSLNGRLQLSTHEITITERRSPEFSLGSLLYVLDQKTYYVLLTDTSGSYAAFRETLPSNGNIRAISATDAQDPMLLADVVPSSAATAILITNRMSGYLANADVSRLPGEVLGVFVTGNNVDFFRRENDRLVPDRRVPAEHELLRIGAAVAGESELYSCARQNFIDRSRMLTGLYENRATTLTAAVDSSCSVTLGDAATLLSDINARGDDYLEELLDQSRTLASLQSSLLTRSCPVIA